MKAAPPKPFDPPNMTHSGLERYVRIAETVRNSDAFLSGADRHSLICDLVDAPGNPTVKETEAECQRLAGANLSYNMIAAQTLREAQRGY